MIYAAASRMGGDMARRPFRRYRLWIVATAALLALGVAVYALWPRPADLRAFDPASVARIETRMWRNYYEERFPALVADLYALGREQYGFSPADSVAIAWYAARAAEIFQPTKSRAEAQQALPLLEQYYALLRALGGETFDAREAARLELDWWQLRREGARSPQYGLVIAQATSVVFHADNDDVKRAGLLRAEMMAYRDARDDGRMQAADWAHIEDELTRSYQALHAGIAGR